MQKINVIKKHVNIVCKVLEQLLIKEKSQLVHMVTVGMIVGILTCSLFSENIQESNYLINFILASVFLCLLYIVTAIQNSYHVSSILCRFVSIFCISFCLGLLSVCYNSYTYKNKNSKLVVHDIYYTIIGSIYNIRPTSKGGAHLYINVDIASDFTITNTPKRIKLYALNYKIQNISIGDTIIADALLRLPEYKVFPGGYDAKQHAKFENIDLTGFIDNQIRIIDVKQQSYFSSIIYSTKAYIHSILHKNMSKDTASFADAIILGESKGMNLNILNNMRVAGLSHILCVSGLHLSLVSISVFYFLRLTLNIFDTIAFNTDIKKISGIISLLVSFFYLCLSGAQIAASRAFIMTFIVMLSIIFGRTASAFRSLSIAASLLLFFKPYCLLQPSFQLSFTAVASLITCYKDLFNIPKIYIITGKSMIGRIFLYTIGNMYSSIIVSIFTAPITVYYFYSVPKYTILSNLIAVPVVSFFIMPIAIVAVLSMLFNLHYYPLILLEKSINLVIYLSELISSRVDAVVPVGQISNAIFLLLMLSFLWYCMWQNTIRLLCIVPLIISLVVVFNTAKPSVMIDLNKKIIGINQNGLLNTYAQVDNNKNIRRWYEWFGQKENRHKKLSVRKNKKHNINILPISRMFQENMIVEINNTSYINIIAQYFFMTKTKSQNTIVELAFKSFDCSTKSDVIINFVNYNKCANKHTVTRDTLELRKNLLVYCRNKKCEVY